MTLDLIDTGDGPCQCKCCVHGVQSREFWWMDRFEALSLEQKTVFMQTLADSYAYMSYPPSDTLESRIERQILP